MRRRLTIVLVAAAVAPAGCGGGDDATSQPPPRAPAVAAATGPEVTPGNSYSLRLAGGWRDATGSGAPLGSELVLVGPENGGFAANVNVIREDARGAGLDRVQEVFRGYVGGLGGRERRDTQPPPLDGAAARGQQFLRRDRDVDVLQRQVFTIHDGAVYTITFAAARDRRRRPGTGVRSDARHRGAGATGAVTPRINRPGPLIRR